MNASIFREAFVVAVLAASMFGTLAHSAAQKPERILHPVVPGTWDDVAIAELEVPLATPSVSPKHVSADYYYRIPVRPIYKSYPVYAPGHEPAGYWESLRSKDPIVIWDDSDRRPPLDTEHDWIKAGEIVFDAPIFYDSVATASWVRDRRWYEQVKPPLARDGTLPFAGYVIREKGKIELGNNACGFCHTRVMPDGTVIKGAQGNFPVDRSNAFGVRKGFAASPDRDRFARELRLGIRNLLAAPWLPSDPNLRLERMSVDDQIGVLEAIPAGVLARTGTSALFPPQIPDLIGIKDRSYLDHTGLVRQRSVADLMRYAALNNEADRLDAFGDFIPGGEDFHTLPAPDKVLPRYSDEQLYALARYIYSLQPPLNPNTLDARAERGQRIFERERCSTCHTPPLFTNNKLTPAPGFSPPAGAEESDHIVRTTVGTDPRLALQTRRGTGFYKVPSVKGVWYRGMFEHNGSCATLEDWFDPQRLRDDYTPTGFKGYGVKTRAVKGHVFGLNLSADDKRALIAFLKTL
jgi:cytochrome c551/c552